MRVLAKTLLSVTALVALSACGGGGGDKDTPKVNIPEKKINLSIKSQKLTRKNLLTM